jgi:hypothetical protein
MNAMQAAATAMLLAVAACAGVGGMAVPDLSADSNPPITIATPGPNVPPDYAAFVGKWGGVWGSDPTWTTTLVVETVTPAGKAKVTYFFQDNPKSQITANIADGVLSWSGRGEIKFKFSLAPDGRLLGIRDNGEFWHTETMLRRI